MKNNCLTITTFLVMCVLVSATFAGFDGNGVYDYFTVRANGNLEWYLGSADNAVSTNSSPFVITTSVSAIEVGDFDKDNVMDLFVGRTGGGALAWYKSSGPGGGVTSVVGSITTHSIVPGGLAIGDYGDNGENNLFALNEAGALLRWRCSGQGSIAYELVHTTGVTCVGIYDFDGDGVDELYIGRADRIDVYEKYSDGTYSSSFIDETGAKGIEFGDFDGDGNADMFIIRSDGTVAWYKSGGINTAPVFVEAFSDSAISCTLADVDGDGTAELIVNRGSLYPKWYEPDYEGGISEATFTGLWSGHFDNAAIGFQRFNVDLPAVVFSRVVVELEKNDDPNVGYNDIIFPKWATSEDVSNRLMLSYQCGKHPGEERPYHLISSDTGMTWMGGNFGVGWLTNLELPGIGPSVAVGFPTYEVSSRIREGIFINRWVDSMAIKTIDATFEWPFDVVSAAFHKGMVLLDDGTILALCYIQRVEGGVREVAVMQSTDNGYNWTYRSTAAAQQSWMGPEGPNENDIVRLRDGRLLCVARTGTLNTVYTDPLEVPMIYMLSEDNGYTWSSPVSMATAGVDPSLIELDNGIVALAYGRPGNHLKFYDPTTDNWSEPYTIWDGSGCGYTAFAKDYETGDLLIGYTASDFGGRDTDYWVYPGDYNQLMMVRLAVEQPCGGDGYKAVDFNFDCNVDLEDFSEISSNWMSSNP